jgi:uncharacterized protein (TIGR02118 family)
MSSASVLILYPRKDTSTFDADYYLNKHMPLAKSHWAKHGLKSYTVTELSGDGPYAYSTVAEFESMEAFGRAVQDPGTKEIMEDVKNFSSEQAVLVHGAVIGRG